MAWSRLAIAGLLAFGCAVAVLLLHAAPAHAASAFDFDVWMRAIDQRSVSVQKHIAAQRVAEAEADARELGRLYGLMERYFAADYPAEDGERISREGRELAESAAAALAAADFEAAARSTRSIALACNDCHDQHKPFK